MLELKEQRKLASEQSMGQSSSIIHDKVVDIVSSMNLSEGELLDFGAGRGDLLKKFVQKVQLELHGVDLMKTEVAGVTWHEQDLNEPVSASLGAYNVVTAVEVIEHLENPRQTVRDIYGLLKPGGRVVLTTPNNESWRSILSYVMRGHFVAFTDSSYPAHITALNLTDLLRVFKEAGFINIKAHYTDSGQVPKMAGMTWQTLSFGWLKHKRFSDNVIITAEKAD